MSGNVVGACLSLVVALVLAACSPNLHLRDYATPPTYPTRPR